MLINRDINRKKTLKAQKIESIQSDQPRDKPLKTLKAQKIESAESNSDQPQKSPQTASAPSDHGDQERRAEIIKRETDEVNEINRYLSGFKKQLSRHIAYPDSAKKLGVIGVPTVGFSVLEDGSVSGAVIIKSSGYAALDEAALQAVRQAAPFARPPRPLHQIGVEIYFKRD